MVHLLKQKRSILGYTNCSRYNLDEAIFLAKNLSSS